MSKRAFESVITPVMNGVVVEIGCKVFVGKADSLSFLVEYYDGKVPKEFKKI